MYTLRTHRVTALLIGVAFALTVISAAAIYARDVLGITRIAGVGYLQTLRIDREVSNLPVWYESSLLLLGALSIAGVGARVRHRAARIRWWVLAALVLLMSIDESVRIHERLGAVVHNLTGVRLSWMVPGALAVAVVIIGTRQVWRTVTRRDRMRFLQAAAVFVVGAIGTEIVHKLVAPGAGGLVHYGLVHLEEALEMCGAALLLRAAWLAIAPGGDLAIMLGPAEQPLPATPSTTTPQVQLTQP